MSNEKVGWQNDRTQSHRVQDGRTQDGRTHDNMMQDDRMQDAGRDVEQKFNDGYAATCCCS